MLFILIRLPVPEISSLKPDQIFIKIKNFEHNDFRRKKKEN